MSNNISSIESCEKLSQTSSSTIEKHTITKADLARYKAKVDSYSGGMFTRPLDAHPDFRYYWVTDMVSNQLNVGRVHEMLGLEYERVLCHECPLEAAKHGFTGGSNDPITNNGMILMKIHNKKFEILQAKAEMIKQKIRSSKNSNSKDLILDKRETTIGFM